MRVGNVSFKSTYAIKYNYTLMKAYGYASPNNKVRDFIDLYNQKYKAKEAVSAINPKEKTYFVKIPDRYDFFIKALAERMNVKSRIKKVNDKKMEGAIITSIGRTSDEISLISQRISDYEHLKTLERESFLP